MRHSLPALLLLAGVVGSGQGAGPAFPAGPPPVPAALAEVDRINLERNLRWVLAREREGEKKATGPRVAVFADAGVWHPGARSIVAALEAEGVSCRVLDRTRVTPEGLASCGALVLPGGWAPHQRAALDRGGLDAIRVFVDGGGRCLGICAGAYLLSHTVAYEGKEYPYPLGLFDGRAVGPVPGLAVFPKPGAVRLRLSAAGRERGLTTLAEQDRYYSGGPALLGGSGAVVLASYPDGTPAAVARPTGRGGAGAKGEVILVGVHPERPVVGGEEAPPPADAGRVLRALLRR